MTWSLVVMVYVLSSGLFEGTPIETGMDLERCMAKAVSMRFGDVSDQQYICWPEQATIQKDEARHG